MAKSGQKGELPYSSAGGGKTRRFGRALAQSARLVMKLVLIAGFIIGGVLVGGFLQFSSIVTQQASTDDVAPAEGVVVLTGGSARIAKALDLMALKKGQRLLISGVNPVTQSNDLKKINADHAGLFDCCIDIEHEAVDTVGNAVETRKWLREQNFSSVIVVTSSYHMPRSLIEFRRVMPDTEITSVAVPLSMQVGDQWWRDPETLRIVLSEYMKFIGALSRDYLNADTLSSLRAGVLGGS